MQERIRLTSRFSDTLGISQQVRIFRRQAQRHHQHRVGAIGGGKLLVEHPTGFVEIFGLLVNVWLKLDAADEGADQPLPFLAFAELFQTLLHHVLGFGVVGVVGQSCEPRFDLVHGGLVASEVAAIGQGLQGILQAVVQAILDRNGDEAELSFHPAGIHSRQGRRDEEVFESRWAGAENASGEHGQIGIARTEAYEHE